MFEKGEDPIGSMGRDIPLASLSDKNRLLYDYFFQNFAQVTNPPIDPIREELVMSLLSFIGPRPNLLDIASGKSMKRLELNQPILKNNEIEKIKYIDKFKSSSFKTFTVSICEKIQNNKKMSFEKAILNICSKVEQAVNQLGCNIIVLSDKDISKNKIPLPALLVTSAIHHYLIIKGLRTEVGLVVETGEARRVHDICLLSGYGAEAINPYLAFDTISDILKNNKLSEIDEYHNKYIKAINKGMLKVMSKMGISTFQSYCGAQIFDAVGLSSKVVNSYFTGTSSKVEGIGIDEIQLESEKRHTVAFKNGNQNFSNELEEGGDLRYRIKGEKHIWNPETIQKLQYSVRSSNYEIFKQYSNQINDQSQNYKSLRGLLKLNKINKPVAIEDVEPATEIVKRFATGAMSLGSISSEAHTTLAIAMNRLGGRSNTGEGGEESAEIGSQTANTDAEDVSEETSYEEGSGDTVVVGGGGEGEGCAGIADRLGVPIVGVNMVTDGVVSDNCSNWFVGYSPAPSTLGPSWNVAIDESIGRDNIATPWYVIGDAPDWGRATADAWLATTGVETGGQDFAPGGTTDWQPFIEKMQSSGLVGAITAISWGTQYNAFIQQAGDSGASEAMILSHPVGVPEFIVNSPGLAPYLTTWRNLGQWGGIWTFEDEWDTSRSAGVNILHEVNEKHFELFGTAPAGQALQQAGGYFMLQQAIDRADSTEPEAILSELVNDFFWGPTWDRPVNVDLPGRQVSVPFGLTQVVELVDPPYGDAYAHDLVAWIGPEAMLGQDNAVARGVLDVCQVGAPTSFNGAANQTSRVN